MAEYIYHADPIGDGEYSHTLVGELVRCGECWYRDKGEYEYCPILKKNSYSDFFCAYGERGADDE